MENNHACLLYLSRLEAVIVELVLLGVLKLDCVVGLVGQGGLVELIRRFSVIESHNVHEIIEIVVLSLDSQHTDLSRISQSRLPHR